MRYYPSLHPSHELQSLARAFEGCRTPDDRALLGIGRSPNHKRHRILPQEMAKGLQKQHLGVLTRCLKCVCEPHGGVDTEQSFLIELESLCQ
jgi:hypothetical protein